MHLEDELLKEHSKKQTLKIIKYVGSDAERFSELMKLFFSKEKIIHQRAGWSMSYIVEKHPSLLLPYIKKLLDNLNNPVHGSVKRNTVRALQYVDLPEKITGRVTDSCFKLLSSANEEIAVRVFSMTVLYHITLKYPELINELKQCIELILINGSAGIRSRGNKILKDLEKLKYSI